MHILTFVVDSLLANDAAIQSKSLVFSAQKLSTTHIFWVSFVLCSCTLAFYERRTNEKLTWCFTDVNSLPGTYVAFSLQSGIAKSWQSTCAKYSHTAMKQTQNFVDNLNNLRINNQFSGGFGILIHWKCILCVNGNTYSYNEQLVIHRIAFGIQYKIFSCDALVPTNNALRDFLLYMVLCLNKVSQRSEYIFRERWNYTL